MKKTLNLTEDDLSNYTFLEPDWPYLLAIRFKNEVYAVVNYGNCKKLIYFLPAAENHIENQLGEIKFIGVMTKKKSPKMLLVCQKNEDEFFWKIGGDIDHFPVSVKLCAMVNDKRHLICNIIENAEKKFSGCGKLILNNDYRNFFRSELLITLASCVSTEELALYASKLKIESEELHEI